MLVSRDEEEDEGEGEGEDVVECVYVCLTAGLQTPLMGRAKCVLYVWVCL